MYINTSIDHIKVLDLSRPLYAQMELTKRCNYDCLMCYNIWHTGFLVGKELSKDEHLKIIEILGPHIFSIIFSGGEPTLVTWLPQLIEKARGTNTDCTIITNAENITASLAHALHDAGLQNAQVSLHHYLDDINDWITNTKGSVKETLEGGKQLLHYLGKDSVGICMVVNKRTVRDVYSMGEFLLKNGFNQMVVGILSYSGKAAINKLTIDVKDLHIIYEQLVALNNDLGLDVGFTGGIPFCILPKGWENAPVHIHNTCDAAIHQIVVGPDGECRPCVEYPFSGGNILTKPLEDIWSSTMFSKIRMFENVPGSCVSCRHVGTCHGGCRAAALSFTGNLCGLDPFLKEGKNDLL